MIVTTCGSVVKKPKVSVNYKAWGVAGNLSVTQTSTDITPYINKLNDMIDLRSYTLVKAEHVEHYQAKHDRLDLLWLRFEATDAVEKGLGTRHISATFNVRSGQLMGLMRMLPELDHVGDLTHQQALDTAIDFVRQHAPELIKRGDNHPVLNNHSNCDRLGFSPHLDYENVQFRWIGQHTETLAQTGERVVGMKVKMFIPESSLWCWVVVDKNNQVMTFERDISWNFYRVRRRTQMWLHDAWLLANSVESAQNDCKIIDTM